MAIVWTKVARAASPRLITRRDIIKSAPAQFRGAYPDDGKRSHTGEAYGLLHARLDALDLETCPRSAVDEIIGNNSWTQLQCEVCEMDRDAILHIPREYSEGVRICADCGAGIVAAFAEEGGVA